MTRSRFPWLISSRQLSIRDVSLFVEVAGEGYPLLLMHGGPGADHWSMLPFRRLADQFALVFYDHRCNGRSGGAPLTSLNWENLTADAEALRQVLGRELGFERWAVLGHSFGGMVALEYALRYPDSLSHLVLLDTGGDSYWQQQNGPRILARRGYRPRTVDLARRFFNGQIEPEEMVPRERRVKARPEALVYAGGHLLKGWSAMHRLGEIEVPTLVMPGRDDFQFPPEHQAELAARIPNAYLEIIECAGHNAHTERPAEVCQAVREFLRGSPKTGLTPESPGPYRP